MRNILLFFAKNGSTLLFIFLEAICFYLIINYNTNQRSIFLHSSNTISGKIQSEQRRFNDFFSLNERVDSLQEANADLLRRVLYYEGYGKSPAIDSSTFGYELIPAKIINQSIMSRNNYLTIDKGKMHGVVPDMGVIDQNGLVGIVQKSNSKYARVLSLLNSKTRISARIKHKGYFGNLIWPDLDHRRMQLEAIPSHANVAIGDTVVTSGFSSIFPPEIAIGIVEEVITQKGDANYEIAVKLNNSFSDVDYVFVIKNYGQELQQSLESE